MAFNDAGGVQVALSTFGGLVTNVPATNVPEGASPDNQEAVFRPGAVGQRPGLLKQFATPFGTETVTYGKSYIDPQGTIRNVYLTSSGGLYYEDVTNFPGLYGSLGTVTSGSYAKSITAFGREYIAVSDALYGSDIPLQYDGTNLDRVTQDGPGSNPTIASLALGDVAMAPDLTAFPGFSMARVNNIVTVATALPHSLQVGFRVQISGVTAEFVLADQIVINNEDNPGIATVTTNVPHGLVPGQFANIVTIPPVEVGGGIVGISRQGQVVVVTTATAHGLSPGASVNISGVADTSFNATFIVQETVNTTTFTYIQGDFTNATDSTGIVELNWPFQPGSGNLFEVLTAPTTTTFTIAIQYSNGTWLNTTGTGAVHFQWDGLFYVSAVLSATEFQYFQYGPNAFSTSIGTVTPYGQVTGGEHQMQVAFLTRQGYITRPSPPVKFVANGGQYLYISNLPIGPANVVARILMFTGVQGAYFFYIPVPAVVNGQKVSTATVVNDNTSTAVLLDFSDNTLYASLATTIPGNNLPAQIVLDGALGFGYFGFRLITWGQRNTLQSLLNMHFDGGYLPSAATMPTGWTAAGGGAGGQLVTTGRFGGAWEVTGAGSIYQSGYLDGYGAPILQPNTKYRLRGWVKGAAETATVTISSASTAFSSTATLTPGTAGGAWLEANFNNTMPAEIPSDMIVSLSGSTGAIIDELSIIYRESPYLDKIIFGSYVNNPEAFDGVSGKFGPADDTHKVMDCAIIRANLYMLTRDPAGRIHQTSDNGVTQPVGWQVNQIASNCGALSAFCVTKSQADDASAGGGEEWIAWASASGARIFSGNEPWKISDEILPDWNTINRAAYKTIWSLNDPAERRLYFGLPIGVATAPNIIYPMDYKLLDTAYEISQASPTVRGAGGGLASRDICRKWTRWNLSMNGAALTYRSATSGLYPTFLYGNGAFPGTEEGGCGNVYILCENKLTDDCFGQIFFYYTTYFFTGAEIEQQIQLGAQRKTLLFFQYQCSGVGRVRVTAYANSLDNPWPYFTERSLRVDPTYDDEWPGANVIGQRIAFKFQALPVEE